MARRQEEIDPDNELEFREPPRRASTHGTSWVQVLQPLVRAPGRWAMIKTFDTPGAASSAQGNLTSGKVHIPYPNDEWVFAARGCELFAVYHGKKVPGAARRAQLERQ